MTKDSELVDEEPRQADAYYNFPQRGPDGNWLPVETVKPMNGPFVGGFDPQRSLQVGEGQHGSVGLPQPSASGYTEPNYRPPAWVNPLTIPGATAANGEAQGTMTHPGPPASALERQNSLPPMARMSPHLQFMCGPLLRYDTVDHNKIWRGAAMIVTADGGSQYDPHPMLSLEWDPDRPVHVPEEKLVRSSTLAHDPTRVPLPGHHPSLGPNAPTRRPSQPAGARARRTESAGQEIWVYHGTGGTFTFWRFMIEIPLYANEMGVRYKINGGQEIEFFVPGAQQNMRWAAHSCNGFSAGINPDDFKGPGFHTGFDPVWQDLLDKHVERPYHVLVGGGDQIYCDPITREPELQEWVNLKTPEARIAFPLTDSIRFCLDRFYFSHYCLVFRNGAFARANSSIPMANMLDDHDLIDGFGSYPEDLQLAPVFSAIGSRGYFFFLLFQCFINDPFDGTNPTPGQHWCKSMIIGGEGPYIPFPGHTFLTYLGPKVSMLLLDCRAERRKDQVVSALTYDRVFKQIYNLPSTVEHLIIQLGIPIAYPRMNFLETALDSKFNPIVSLGKSGSLNLGGFLNKFNKDAELLDDLSDHWTAKDHKKERNWFIQQCQRLALTRRLRITFLSGDVHCAAVGVFKTLQKSRIGRPIAPPEDHRYMINVVTSAIVNTPPPQPVLTMVGMLADKKHSTMHFSQTDETMLPVFTQDTNGQSMKPPFIMGRRNWTSAEIDDRTGDLAFDIRVEKEKGCGVTVGYGVRAPPPRWRQPTGGR